MTPRRARYILAVIKPRSQSTTPGGPANICSSTRNLLSPHPPPPEGEAGRGGGRLPSAGPAVAGSAGEARRGDRRAAGRPRGTGWGETSARTSRRGAPAPEGAVRAGAGGDAHTARGLLTRLGPPAQGLRRLRAAAVRGSRRQRGQEREQEQRHAAALRARRRPATPGASQRARPRRSSRPRPHRRAAAALRPGWSEDRRGRRWKLATGARAVRGRFICCQSCWSAAF